MTKAEHRLIWIQATLLTIGTTALLYGAFAHIGWLFWGVGLPLEIIAFFYSLIAASFIQISEDEKHHRQARL